MSLYKFIGVFLLIFSLSAQENILVTGGAGYIGSHTAKALYEAGYHPIVLDNLKTGYLPHVRWGTFVKGDVQDAKLLQELFAKYHPKAVIHFAASTQVGESVLDPAEYYENNTLATFTLINTMRKEKMKNLIFSSTCAVYGTPKQVPIDESHPRAPESPYAHSKAMSEQMIEDFQKAYSLNYVIFRYFNAAGADYQDNLGDTKTPPSHLIPIVLHAAETQKEMAIFGDDYPTIDGTGVRDYISVQDLAIAHVKAVDYLLRKNKSRTFNLGTGSGYSVKEIIETAQKCTQISIPYRMAPRRPGDIASAIADSSLAAKHLNWCPRNSELFSLIDAEWQWSKTFN
ncbi:MAG: UDP-glucose 4-epimerase GalE [Chlamydiales bacterium]